MDTCTLCHAPIPEYPQWGIDYPQCGPVRPECADYDYWLYSREDASLQNTIINRHIRDHGWLPTPCAVPEIWIYSVNKETA